MAKNDSARSRRTILTSHLWRATRVSGWSGQRSRPAQGQDLGLGKRATGNVEDRVLKAGEALGRLDGIAKSFRPELLKLGNQIGSTVLGWAEKAGVKLNAEQQSMVADQATFRAKTIGHLNAYLHDMSGAAISPAEAKRLQAAMPSVNDGPTEFAAKYQSVVAETKAIIETEHCGAVWWSAVHAGDHPGERAGTKGDVGRLPAADGRPRLAGSEDSPSSCEERTVSTAAAEAAPRQYTSARTPASLAWARLGSTTSMPRPRPMPNRVIWNRRSNTS